MLRPLDKAPGRIKSATTEEAETKEAGITTISVVVVVETKDTTRTNNMMVTIVTEEEAAEVAATDHKKDLTAAAEEAHIIRKPAAEAAVVDIKALSTRKMPPTTTEVAMAAVAVAMETVATVTATTVTVATVMVVTVVAIKEAAEEASKSPMTTKKAGPTEVAEASVVVIPQATLNKGPLALIRLGHSEVTALEDSHREVEPLKMTNSNGSTQSQLKPHQWLRMESRKKSDSP